MTVEEEKKWDSSGALIHISDDSDTYSGHGIAIMALQIDSLGTLGFRQLAV